MFLGQRGPGPYRPICYVFSWGKKQSEYLISCLGSAIHETLFLFCEPVQSCVFLGPGPAGQRRFSHTVHMMSHAAAAVQPGIVPGTDHCAHHRRCGSTYPFTRLLPDLIHVIITNSCAESWAFIYETSSFNSDFISNSF